MGVGSMEPWEIAAREGARDAIARYTHAGDRFLMDEFIGNFTADGVLEIKGQEPLVGRAAILEYFTSRPITGTGPRRATILRHNVTNVLFEEVTPTLVRAASYFTVFTDVGLDHMGRYRDEVVPDGDAWRLRYRLARPDWFSPDSLIAGGATTSS